MNMRRRHYFLVFILLFGAALWGLFHAINMTVSNLSPIPPGSAAPLPPEAPAAATQSPQNGLTNIPQ